MRRIRLDGAKIKRLREDRTTRSTQKELAHEVRISERLLRAIENTNALVAADVAERLARALDKAVPEVLLAADDVIVPSPPPVTASVPPTPRRDIVPRFDTAYARATSNEASFYEDARAAKTLVAHILTPLTAETSAYAEELLGMLRDLTWECLSPLDVIDPREEIRYRRRLRELLVLLKGNDIWVYADSHFKFLPESLDIPPRGTLHEMETQFIVAFGPPGEYGETSLKVPIDHGQPFALHP